MPSSLFIPIFLDFSLEDERQQALKILAEADHFFQQGYTKVGITYSANHDQTEAINLSYQQNLWHTGTSGSNQAQVISQVEGLLASNPRFIHLQQVFRILPITTCEHGGAGTIVSENIMDEWLEKDLGNVTRFIEQESHVVLGWQNQLTVENLAAPFAIGGGVSQRQLTKQQVEKIQNTLKSLSERYLSSKEI